MLGCTNAFVKTKVASLFSSIPITVWSSELLIFCAPAGPNIFGRSAGQATIRQAHVLVDGPSSDLARCLASQPDGRSLPQPFQRKFAPWPSRTRRVPWDRRSRDGSE